jgi:hypothetical protein
MGSWTEDIHGNIIPEKRSTVRQSDKKSLEKNDRTSAKLQALQKDIRDEAEKKETPDNTKKLQTKVKTATKKVLQLTEQKSLTESIQKEL